MHLCAHAAAYNRKSMKQFDVLVRGAGIVGQSLALSLARIGLQVAAATADARRAARPTPANRDVRAYALNAASVRCCAR